MGGWRRRRLSCSSHHQTGQTVSKLIATRRPGSARKSHSIYPSILCIQETRLLQLPRQFSVSDAGGCAPVIQKEELKVLPNYDEPRVIINMPSSLASGKLGVGLTNGMLASVNSESNPEFSELIKEVSGAVGTFGIAGTPGPSNACNAAPRITDFTAITP